MLKRKRLFKFKVVTKLSICCSKEINRVSAHNKFKETKILRRVQRLQNGGNIATEQTFRKYNCFCKIDLKYAYFLEPPEICEFSMTRKSAPISFSMFWPFLCSKSFHKTHESLNIYFEETENNLNSKATDFRVFHSWMFGSQSMSIFRSQGRIALVD